MRFRLHDKNTNTIITRGFILTPTGNVLFNEKEDAPLDYAIQKGIFIEEQPVFIGDAIALNLQENNLSAEDIRCLLHMYGAARQPEEVFDKVVIELMAHSDDDGYGTFMFQNKGEFLQEPPEEGMIEGNYRISMKGLAFVRKFLYRKKFSVAYNFTSPKWQNQEFFLV